MNKSNTTMYKRPPLRVKDAHQPSHNLTKLDDNGFLHKLVRPPPTQWSEKKIVSVFQKENYLTLLKKNYEECGLELKERFIPDLPEKKHIVVTQEPFIDCIDKVYMKIRILKSGIVRVKLDTSIVSLYENYYSQNKIPPLKSVIQAHKSLGFSEAFLEKIKKKHERRTTFGKKISKVIDLIFNKEPVKKTKKKKEVVEVDEEIIEELEEDETQEDDIPEDGGMDVDLDEDADEEPQEEMYLSDGGD